jgi:hypothetical protein
VGSFAQSLQGTFMRDDESAGIKEGYYFRTDGEFSWFRLSKTGKEIGTGGWRIINDSIQLNFKTTRRQFDIQAQSVVKTNASKATIRVNVIRASGKNFAGLKFILSKSSITGVTDKSGTAFAEIENPRDKDDIYFEIDGYRTSGLPINLKNRDNFIAIVVDDVTKYRENGSVEFKIDRTRRVIKLTDGRGEVTFKKTRSKEYMKAYLGA